MAISRTRTSPQQEVATRLSLGRIRVTIDDLNALLDVLKHDLSEDEGVVIRFDGGHFDNPADMHQLSDVELRGLVVVSPNVQVLLSNRQAIAVGDNEACEAVYRMWARNRQTTQPPEDVHKYSGIRELKPKTRGLIVAAMSFILGLLFGSLMFGNESTPATPFPQIPITPRTITQFALIAIMIAFICYTEYLNRKSPPSYAVIIPSSLEELRKEAPLQARHRITVWVTATGIVVAAITMIATKAIWK